MDTENGIGHFSNAIFMYCMQLEWSLRRVQYCTIVFYTKKMCNCFTAVLSVQNGVLCFRKQRTNIKQAHNFKRVLQWYLPCLLQYILYAQYALSKTASREKHAVQSKQQDILKNRQSSIHFVHAIGLSHRKLADRRVFKAAFWGWAPLYMTNSLYCKTAWITSFNVHSVIGVVKHKQKKVFEVLYSV